MSRQLCIYVDVDDTLVRSAGSKRIPVPAVTQHVASYTATERFSIAGVQAG